jgi:hypothetical protein
MQMSGKEKPGLDYIFPCTGNSGSVFITDYLINAGVKCGHEDVFQAQREEVCLARPPGYLVKKQGYRAESSCFANPYLKHHVARGARCLHLIRDPYKVVRSWSLSMGGIGIANYFEQWLDIYDLWPYQKTLLYSQNWRDPNWLAGVCVQWNRMVQVLRPDSEILRVEDAASTLMAKLGLPEDTKVPPKDTNSKVDPSLPFELKISDPEILTSFNEWAEENGYEAKATAA